MFHAEMHDGRLVVTKKIACITWQPFVCWTGGTAWAGLTKAVSVDLLAMPVGTWYAASFSVW